MSTTSSSASKRNPFGHLVIDGQEGTHFIDDDDERSIKDLEAKIDSALQFGEGSEVSVVQSEFSQAPSGWGTNQRWLPSSNSSTYDATHSAAPSAAASDVSVPLSEVSEATREMTEEIRRHFGILQSTTSEQLKFLNANIVALAKSVSELQKNQERYGERPTAAGEIAAGIVANKVATSDVDDNERYSPIDDIEESGRFSPSFFTDAEPPLPRRAPDEGFYTEDEG